MRSCCAVQADLKPLESSNLALGLLRLWDCKSSPLYLAFHFCIYELFVAVNIVGNQELLTCQTRDQKLLGVIYII